VLLSLILSSQLALADTPDVRVDWLPAQPWPAGQRLYVAGHEVNLRAAASTDAPVVRELDLGTPVIVRAVLADEAEVGGRPGRWYAVEIEGAGIQGALFGGVLTRRASTRIWTRTARPRSRCSPGAGICTR
jgi:hypothetical protein